VTNHHFVSAAFGPPSGILLHTLGIGFLIGIDIYDTVLVLRTQEAVDAFAHPKISIGAELSVAAGPLGSGGALDIGFTDKSPAWVYTKSRGFYAGIALDGTVVIERNDENERFYGRRVKAAELIKGAAGIRRPVSADGLIATIEMAEGKVAREDMIPTRPAPSELQGAFSEPPTPDPWATQSQHKVPPLPVRRSGDSPGTLSEQPIASSSRISPSSVLPPSFTPSGTPSLPARRSTTIKVDPFSQKDKAKDPLDGQSDPPYEDAPPPYSDDDIEIEDKRTPEKGL
jgi:hypothetical protein